MDRREICLHVHAREMHAGEKAKENAMTRLMRIRTFLFALVLCALPASAFAGVFVSVNIAPPVLPVYAQPACPGDGFLWTPGYWAYGPAGYYWVPGVWVRPPRVGLLWTPGYWGFGGGVYAWHPGYWGPHVGFYGGVNYGFGYTGVGFIGGFWGGGFFHYNTAVFNVNRAYVHNTYIDRTVIHNTVINRTSFNGPGGIMARPTPQDRMAMNEQHFGRTAEQNSHEQLARNDRSQLASFNHGHPGTMAMNTVNERRYNQQQRISNGIRDGQMTPGEAARAENRQASINRQVRNDREANGGRLTGQERQQINRRQNNASRQIYRENHNDKKAPR
jgi:hypothetical protein